MADTFVEMMNSRVPELAGKTFPQRAGRLPLADALMHAQTDIRLAWVIEVLPEHFEWLNERAAERQSNWLRILMPILGDEAYSRARAEVDEKHFHFLMDTPLEPDLVAAARERFNDGLGNTARAQIPAALANCLRDEAIANDLELRQLIWALVERERQTS